MTRLRGWVQRRRDAKAAGTYLFWTDWRDEGWQQWVTR